MKQIHLLLSVVVAMTIVIPSAAERIPVRQQQLPRRGSMVARSSDGKVVANFEILQTVQGDEVTIQLTYHFLDGSIDEETTTYSQRGTFGLVRNHHVQKGPFFTRPVDFAVDARTGTATSITTDSGGKAHSSTEHLSLPDDVANGFIGTLLLNVPRNTPPFHVGLVTPFGGGRLVKLTISPEGEQSFLAAGQPAKATVFRIHPELGGIIGILAKLIGIQPKDVMVWVQEGDRPAVVRIVGQLGGYGPVLSSELEGDSFGR